LKAPFDDRQVWIQEKTYEFDEMAVQKNHQFCFQAKPVKSLDT
jgi:hypothetical protein